MELILLNISCETDKIKLHTALFIRTAKIKTKINLYGYKFVQFFVNSRKHNYAELNIAQIKLARFCLFL